MQPGTGSSLSDSAFEAADAIIPVTTAGIQEGADLLLKTKEPATAEYPHLRIDQALSTYLHVAADRPQAEALVGSCTATIAYRPAHKLVHSKGTFWSAFETSATRPQTTSPSSAGGTAQTPVSQPGTASRHDEVLVKVASHLGFSVDLAMVGLTVSG